MTKKIIQSNLPILEIKDGMLGMIKLEKVVETITEVVKIISNIMTVMILLVSVLVVNGTRAKERPLDAMFSNLA
jgi:hypothetical protein